MERAIVNEEYDYHTYEMLLDKANWEDFKNERVKALMLVKHWNGDRIRVKSIDNLKMWATDIRTVRLSADVTYQKSYYKD